MLAMGDPEDVMPSIGDTVDLSVAPAASPLVVVLLPNSDGKKKKMIN